MLSPKAAEALLVSSETFSDLVLKGETKRKIRFLKTTPPKPEEA